MHPTVLMTARHLAIAAALATLSGCTMTRGVDPASSEALHDAVRTGSEAATRIYIQDGADVNAPDADGYPPLHRAVESGNKNIVSLLLEAGADLNEKSRAKTTPVYHAASAGQARMVNHLIDLGADVNRSGAVYAAVQGGHLEIARRLLAAGGDPEKTGAKLLTPLFAAVVREDVEAVRLLLQAGANPLSVGDSGRVIETPWSVAKSRGNREILALLEEYIDTGGSPPEPDEEEQAKPESTVAAAETSAAAAMADGALAHIDADRIYTISAAALVDKYPDLEITDYMIGHLACVTHPSGKENTRIYVEWIGRKTLELRKGETPEQDRVRLEKLQVKLDGKGKPLDVGKSSVWVRRDAAKSGELPDQP